jgi:hypothetical protein
MPIGLLVLYEEKIDMELLYKKQIEEEQERRRRLQQERIIAEPERAEYSKVFNTVLHTPNITRINASTKGNMFGRHKSDRFNRR